MEVKKFQLAMRPKKYLTHDFLVYQDPKMQAARSEMQAGGIVQREGFYKAGLATSGPNKGKWTIRDVWNPKKKIKETKVFKTEEAANKFIEQLKYKSDKFYKSRVILDDPKKKESFLKYANKPGVTTGDIRNKYGLSKEEFFNGGLRDIIDKDFASQRKIQPKTVQNMLKLHNDKEASEYIRKGKIVPDEIIKKLGIKPYAAGTATVRLAQHYGGQDFGYKELNEIRKNKSASQKLFNAMDKFKFGNPYHSNLYNISLELIDEKLGNERGTFGQLKAKARDLLAKNNIQGFDINEIAGVVGSAKSDAAEFSQFIDVMESQLNQGEMASFQSAFSRARENLKTNPENFKSIAKNINKLAENFEGRYGVELPRIGKAEDVEKFYSKKRLAELKEQGLDLVQASQRAGYTVKMPKGAITIQEFTNNPETMKAVIGSLSDDPACALPAKAEGGRIGFQKGSDLCYQQGLKKLDEAKKNPGAAAKLKGKLGKAAKGFGKVLRFLELPFEVAIEGLLVGDAMLRGQSFERAVKGNTLLMRALMPGGYSTSADEQRIKEISENNPAVKTYFDAKQRSDKYQELVNKVEQNEKIAAGLVAPEDIGLTASNLEESKKELSEFIENNYQHFDRDKEILNPEGYHAQQADQAAREYVSKEVYESGYGKGQVAARESQMEDPLADFVQPEQEFEKERLEDVQEQVDQFGFIPTEQEFMQGLNKDSMKQFIKTRYPNMDEQQLNMLTDFAIQQQYQNIRNPYAVYDFSKSVPASPFARGGRVGFSNGGGIRRRTFLKLMAGVGAALGALKSGIIKLSSPVAKKVLKDAPAGTPDWFAPLVDKIMREGVDAGETMKTVTGRETVKKLEVPAPGSDGALTDKYYLYENPDTGEIRVDIDAPGAGANDGEFSFYMRPDRVEGVNDDGTPMLNEGEFFVIEDRAENLPTFSDEVNLELVSNEFNLEDSVSNWHKVEEFATGKTNKKAEAELLNKKSKVESDPVQDVVNRRGEYDYSYARDSDIDD